MLRELANRLRQELPSRAPMDVAEHVQHNIVRLELLAERDLSESDEAEARTAYAMGESLLKTITTMFPKRA